MTDYVTPGDNGERGQSASGETLEYATCPRHRYTYTVGGRGCPRCVTVGEQSCRGRVCILAPGHDGPHVSQRLDEARSRLAFAREDVDRAWNAWSDARAAAARVAELVRRLEEVDRG